MVVRMMKWRPWPPIFSKKMQVNLTVHRLEGFPPATARSGELERVMVDVKWKGPKGGLGSRFRRSLKRVRTTEKTAEETGIVSWEEEFEHVCVFSLAKSNSFQPWDVHFVVLQAVQQGAKAKLSVAGTGIINLADFASPMENTRQTTRINVSRSAGGDTEAALVITVSFVELRTTHEGIESVPRVIVPSLPCIGGPLLHDNTDQQQSEETTERKLKNMKRFALLPNGKKTSGQLDMLDDGKLSPRSDDSSHDSRDLFDSDYAVEDYDHEQAREVEDLSFRKSFSYVTLAGVNLVVEGALTHHRESIDQHVFAENVISICSRATADDFRKEVSGSDSDQPAPQPSMRTLLSWKKRKLGFRSPRARGEPLLNKSYGEEGGDDIDYDRRQSGSPVESLSTIRRKNKEGASSLDISGCLDFGESFSVGSWERTELVSRDGDMKLLSNVFFASIDQRSERAAGESACTALVAVIADWLHHNPTRMPIRAEFDTLIREGSAEWRKLYEMKAYRDRFHDGHFDLDTVLQAKVRPLMVVPGRSFVGFFQPEGVGDCCDFLKGAMSFENIWDAIWEEVGGNSEERFDPAIYIVSWNDHFFVLKVEREACYIIDTLGERLYEGCNQAYILRFDKETSLCHIPKAQDAVEEKTVPSGSSEASLEAVTQSFAPNPSALPTGSSQNVVRAGQGGVKPEQETGNGEKHSDAPKLESTDKVVYKGKESCKQFVKGFFAALPLKELQIDIKKGLMGKMPLHRRLQIEFHFTSLGPIS